MSVAAERRRGRRRQAKSIGIVVGPFTLLGRGFSSTRVGGARLVRSGNPDVNSVIAVFVSCFEHDGDVERYRDPRVVARGKFGHHKMLHSHRPYSFLAPHSSVALPALCFRSVRSFRLLEPEDAVHSPLPPPPPSPPSPPPPPPSPCGGSVGGGLSPLLCRHPRSGGALGRDISLLDFQTASPPAHYTSGECSGSFGSWTCPPSGSGVQKMNGRRGREPGQIMVSC